MATASTLKYNSAIRKEFLKEIEEPSEDIVRLFVTRVYDGRFTQNVRADFQPIVQQAFKDTIRELVNQRLSSALDDDPPPAVASVDEPEADEDGIVTTEEEIEGYNIIKAIVREVVKPDRVTMRDAKSYCAILMDDNNRKPLARLHFNRSTKYIGLFDAEKKEERVQLDSLDDIFAQADKLKETARLYAET